MIRLTCRACGDTRLVSPLLEGMTTGCYRCGKSVRIPGKSPRPPKSADFRPPVAENAQSGGPSSSKEEPRTLGWKATPEEVHFGKVLGLRGEVSMHDIRVKYRELAAQHHPDKVQHLAQSLRDLAAKEMAQINAAYQYFKAKYRG